ncbi:hypothetical protein JCM11641_005014 [Rhodosporidiobolus odoratus]
MHTSVAVAGIATFLAATTALAAPSPKLPYFKPGFKSSSRRFPIKNFATDVSALKYNLTDIPGAPTTHAPRKNVWQTLSEAEAASIVSFLHNQTALNLTAAEDVTPWDNAIGAIDLATPNKTETLEYLAGTAGVPPRMALATILVGATDEPYVEEFLVGPLPVSEETTVSPYSFRTTKGTSKQRRYDAEEDTQYEVYAEVAAEVDDVIEAILGAPSSEFDIWGINPLWHEDGKVITWVGFWGVPENVFDAETLLPQGLYMGFNINGRDPKAWEFLGWLRGGVHYPTTAAFRHAFENGLIETYTRNDAQNSTWIGTDREGAELPYESRPPPMQIAPGGQRFAIDDEEQYVEWMDFSYYWSFRRDTGMRLWNIKYKNQTILAELGLNEALAHYAGNDPVQSGTAYLDDYYGFGPYAFGMLEGYDCPTHAKYVNATFHSNEVSTTHKKAICFYETDMGFPMQRHANGAYLAATKNIAFVMKSASTVGNYDYTFTYTFMLDGSISTEVMASGYIQSAYYAENEEYGYHIADGLSGSMHSHVLNWKADFDILGTKNTLGFHTIEPTAVKYPWSNRTRNTMHLVRNHLENEDDAALEWNQDRMVLIYNDSPEGKNKWGEHRAWRIMPHIGGPGMRTVIQNSTNLGPSMNFATSPLFVTQHHDSEFGSSHAANAYSPYTPVVDFGEYLNGESLEQEDLVLWFNLGMHHVPHTGDKANTKHSTAHAGMLFTPSNYLESDPVRQSSQMIRINYNSSATAEQVQDVLTFGQQEATGLFNLTALQRDYYSYEGDINTRKLPYDPLHPYNETVAIV